MKLYYKFNISFILIILTVLGLPPWVAAQKAAGQLPDWENPQVIGRHKLPGHASFVPFPSIRAALADTAMGQSSPWYQSLDGQWKFKWASKPARAPGDFYKPDFSTANWAS
ncbi:MAG TPA: hypothetical protein VE868_00595, partial [Balneolaceae bacterium]|nr:hypothetical protein [Balneolaceae bacterium]